MASDLESEAGPGTKKRHRQDLGHRLRPGQHEENVHNGGRDGQRPTIQLLLPSFQNISQALSTWLIGEVV
jgi:hypothetical protein